MSAMKFKFYLRHAKWGIATELFARCKYEGDEDHVGFIESSTIRMVDMKSLAPSVEPQPLMAFQAEDAPEALQVLMDELWLFGVRPSDIGTAGHLAATTKHLEDMRSIAFSKLEVAKP